MGGVTRFFVDVLLNLVDILLLYQVCTRPWRELRPKI